SNYFGYKISNQEKMYKIYLQAFLIPEMDALPEQLAVWRFFMRLSINCNKSFLLLNVFLLTKIELIYQ
ncbi:hypothetical protein EFS38_20630, partial [Dickeya undicola]